MNDRPGKKRGRKPTLYPYKGQRLSLPELAELSGWNAETLRTRINEGMTAEQAAIPFKADAEPIIPPSSRPEPLILDYKGEERTLEEWAEIDWVKRRKITKSKLYARIYQLGWAKEEAFGDAPRSRPGTRKITIQTPNGPMTKTMSAWAKHTGIPLSTISRRRSRGWTDAQALEFEPSPSELREAEEAEQNEQDHGSED